MTLRLSPQIVRKALFIGKSMLIALDFETEAIDNRPNYPPKPVGLAIYDPSKAPVYHAWGHPIGNNTSFSNVQMVLSTYLKDNANEFVFHNAPFDCAVIEERMDIKVPWNRVHDTMLMAFLTNPFGELSLKPLCERLLNMPPTERDAVQEWLIRHGIVRANDKNWGAYISKAPGDLVGQYAIGDVERTLKLYEYYTNGGRGDDLWHFNQKPELQMSAEVAQAWGAK